MSEEGQSPEQNQPSQVPAIPVQMPVQVPTQIPLIPAVQPQPQAPVLTPEEEVAARELVESINELIATTMKIVILMDEDECSRSSKYNKPCETCTQVASLKSVVRKILRLSEKLPRRPTAPVTVR